MTQTLPSLHEVTRHARKKTIEQRLLELDGNRKKTAESLDISRQQLQILIKELEIKIPPPVRYRHRWLRKQEVQKKSKSEPG